MATHSSVLAWRIPWTEEPGGVQSLGSQRVRHDWASKHPQHRPQEPAFIPLPHSVTGSTPPWEVCVLQQGWTSVARELHQAPKSRWLETLCSLHFVHSGRKLDPQRGSSCLLHFTCCVAQLYLNLYLKERLVERTTAPIPEVDFGSVCVCVGGVILVLFSSSSIHPKFFLILAIIFAHFNVLPIVMT